MCLLELESRVPLLRIDITRWEFITIVVLGGWMDILWAYTEPNMYAGKRGTPGSNTLALSLPHKDTDRETLDSCALCV